MIAYVKIAEGQSARQWELVPGAVIVDYDASGNVLGVEFLAGIGIDLTEGRMQIRKDSVFLVQSLDCTGAWVTERVFATREKAEAYVAQLVSEGISEKTLSVEEEAVNERQPQVYERGLRTAGGAERGSG